MPHPPVHLHRLALLLQHSPRPIFLPAAVYPAPTMECYRVSRQGGSSGQNRARLTNQTHNPVSGWRRWQREIRQVGYGWPAAVLGRGETLLGRPGLKEGRLPRGRALPSQRLHTSGLRPAPTTSLPSFPANFCPFQVLTQRFPGAPPALCTQPPPQCPASWAESTHLPKTLVSA